jgi:tetratricopeptide repeat protein
MPETESDPTPLSRIELLRLAQSLGVSDADVMTRAELRAAIANANAPAPPPTEQPTTWVGVARRLLASVIERGLNLPDAAALIRGDAKLTTPPKAPPPVATVTLARIYAAQGHLDRAIAVLDEVLLSDPDHELARDLRAQLELRRQENVARDADAPSPRSEDELTPIMPEVALREAAERGATPAGAKLANGAASAATPGPDSLPEPSYSADPAVPAAAPEPTAASAPASEARASEAPLSEPAASEAPMSEPAASEAPGELMAPAFAVVERAESVANGFSAEVPSAAAPVTHDSETPPAPSVASPGTAESEGPATLSVGAVETATAEPSVPGEPPAPTETPAPSSAAAASELAFIANGVANGVAHAGANGDPIASSAEAAVATALPPEPASPVPGLVLIEAEQRERYLYWELGSSGGLCWLHVVSHTPASDGHTERRERRFPVQQRSGALRIEGVPAGAVVRAKLSQEPDGRPVAVAGAVRSRETSFEIQFCPHPSAPLEAIARRARPALARATPIYWDC